MKSEESIEEKAKEDLQTGDEPVPLAARADRNPWRVIRWVTGTLFVLAVIAGISFIQNGSLSIPQATETEVEVPVQEMEKIVAEELDLINTLPLSMDQLPEYLVTDKTNTTGVLRKMDLHTIFPERERIEIAKYVVKEGDTLFGIGDQYNLKPDTILWGNWYTMGGDPHTLRPGQELNILPVDGVLHIWSLGEGLNGVAKFYRVTPEDIINWPGNNLDPDIDRTNPPIEEGTALVIPGGRRDPPSWQMIQITRSNPAVAQVLGPGYCGAISGGLIGDGVFGWPTDSRWLSGYHYMPGVHEAIDIGGAIGVPIMASDDGVVVYSGWNDWGYGYVVVLDHGNGWQTLYAHLSSINLGCGQSASQGQVIGAMGCTGNCTGPHLHFEMRHEVWGRVNPIDMLP
jgi:hypothetical protein